MENAQNNLKQRLTEVQQISIEVSIKYHNMKDRQSFKILGITSGIALAAIGIALGHNWTMRIGFVLVAALLILGTVYGIKKVDQAELRELETLIANTQDQITALKKALKIQQAEQTNHEH